MVDHQIGRHERVDPSRIAAEVGHRVAHDGEVDHRRDAGEVLEDHPGRHERHLGLARTVRPPGGEGPDVVLGDDAIAGVAEHVLEKDLQGHRGPLKVDELAGGGERVVVGQVRTETLTSTKRIADRHRPASHRGYTRLVEEYRGRRPDLR